MKYTLAASIVISILSLSAAEANFERDIKKLYNQVVGKHDDGKKINLQLTDCLKSSNPTTCSLGVMKRYGGEGVNENILQQLSNLGERIEEAKEEGDYCEMGYNVKNCKKAVAEGSLPYLLDSAQLVLETIVTEFPETVRMGEVVRLGELMQKAQKDISFGKNKKDEEELEEALKSVTGRFSTLKVY